MKSWLLVVAVAVLASSVLGETYFKEVFDGDNFDRWTSSKAKGDLGAFTLSAGEWYNDAKLDQGLKTSQDARFYAVSAAFDKDFDNKEKPLVVQFSVKHQQGIDCGGGYVKILPKGQDPEKFDGDSQYNVMFGPDICGPTKKVHVIFNYKGKNLLWKKEELKAESDKLTHLYTLLVNPDNTYEVFVDLESKAKGNLEDDWDFLAPKTIPDPEDKKPSQEEWDERREIVDESDVKPDDWDDEPAQVADPEAKQPEDWDAEEDGEWQAPMIPNPKYKGEWKAKMIPNPAYKGVWKPKDIANPDYVADDSLYHYPSSNHVLIDLWQVKSGSIFDNVVITDSLEEAKAFAETTFKVTQPGEKKMFDEIQEAERKKAEEERKAKEAEEAAKKEAEAAEKDDDAEEKKDDEL